MSMLHLERRTFRKPLPNKKTKKHFTRQGGVYLCNSVRKGSLGGIILVFRRKRYPDISLHPPRRYHLEEYGICHHYPKGALTVHSFFPNYPPSRNWRCFPSIVIFAKVEKKYPKVQKKATFASVFVVFLFWSPCMTHALDIEMGTSLFEEIGGTWHPSVALRFYGKPRTCFTLCLFAGVLQWVGAGLTSCKSSCERGSGHA